MKSWSLLRSKLGPTSLTCIHPEIIGAKHIYTHSAASCNRKCQARKHKKTSDIGFLCSIHLTLPPMASIRSISSRTSYDPTQGLAASTSTLMALPVTKAGQLSVKIRQAIKLVQAEWHEVQDQVLSSEIRDQMGSCNRPPIGNKSFTAYVQHGMTISIQCGSPYVCSSSWYI